MHTAAFIERDRTCVVAVMRRPSEDWDAFVAGHPQTSVYFLSGWTLLAQEVFGHGAWFVEARDRGGRLLGVLPVIHQKTLLGNFATSLGFFNYGGALCDSDATALEMMECARAYAERSGCAYIEFRDTKPRGGAWRVRTDKITMILPLPNDVATLGKQLGAKLRSQIKRTDREQAAVRTGGLELLKDFYEVFCHNMRDLGTPVYPRKFFAAILEKFSQHCVLVVIDRMGKPAAAGFVVIANNFAEIPWAACREDAKPMGFNMKLYWEVLSLVVDRGCTQFDFGRSTVDSGTYKFKKQWGAQPQQLHWHRWDRHLCLQDEERPASSGKFMQYATSVWKRLPLGVANTLGPLVSPSLPW